MQFLKLCILASFFHFIQGGLFSRGIDKLKKKAKDAFGKNHKKGPALNLYGHEPSEYPFSNPQSREINKKKWDEYYECLNSQFASLNSQKTLTPEAVVGFKTSYVELDCKICLSPLDVLDKESITWEFAAINDTHLTPLEYTEHILVTPQDRTLHIYNLKPENSGQYLCKLRESEIAPYFVTVVDISEKNINEVHTSEAPIGPYSKNYEEIEFNLVLDTEWGKWSTCSKCDKVGKKHKLGYCNIYLKSGETKSRSKRESQIMDLFQVFKYGIPCESHILPDFVKKLPSVKGRKNEMMIGYCFQKCPQKKIFEILDKDGKIIEKADNSEGIYSLAQKLPPLEPPTVRTAMYEAKGRDIVLECPGNVNTDAPIQWQIGDKNLIPEKISQDSNGRIYVSITDRIHINKAKISDSNIYSCWQQNELAGTIRLVVETRIELNFNHTIMLIGIVLIECSFLYVFLKVAANRNLVD